MSNRLEREATTRGVTVRKGTGCGNLYITINWNGNENPIEVFAYLGKNGGCTRCQNEALTRAITIGLKYGVPIKEYVDELKGLQCSNPNMWPKGDRTLSCPDAIAKAVEGVTREDS